MGFEKSTSAKKLCFGVARSALALKIITLMFHTKDDSGELEAVAPCSAVLLYIAEACKSFPTNISTFITISSFLRRPYFAVMTLCPIRKMKKKSFQLSVYLLLIRLTHCI